MDQKSEWTITTLREHLLAIINANESAARQRFESSNTALSAALAAAKESVTNAQLAADRAVQKAEIASEKRFDAVNEFRSTLADQQRTLIPRTEVELLFKGLSDRVKVLETFSSEKLSTSRGIYEGWGWAVGVMGIVVTMITLAMYFFKR